MRSKSLAYQKRREVEQGACQIHQIFECKTKKKKKKKLLEIKQYSITLQKDSFGDNKILISRTSRADVITSKLS